MKLVSGFLLVILLFLASCNNCRNKSCVSYSTCEVTSGDCVTNCRHGDVNSSDGTCSCDDFYTGDQCDQETRDTYIGTYIGLIEFNETQYYDTIYLVNDIYRLTKMKDSTSSFRLELENNTVFNFGGVVSLGEYKNMSMSGKGYFYGATLNYEGEVNVSPPGISITIKRPISFKGFRQV